MSRLSNWRGAGSPWHLAQPVADLAAVLRRYGYKVGTIGNDAHLGDDTPEDHTPFSGTGWPAANPYPWVHAADIMSPRAGSGLPSLAQLGAQILLDRNNAAVREIGWLKYMNWTTSAGRCVHDSWKPRYARTSSGDVGHIHLSARTDWTHAHSAYDPVARIRGKARPSPSPTPAPGPSKQPVAVPPFTRTLSYAAGRPMMQGADVRLWQGRMHQRGWTLDVDGVYGPQCVGVCRQFQHDKGLASDGIVGPRTWSAAWSTPVT
jgi:peptidoglycan hydrolase-like protein with peptidoglycan-binding domain